MRPSRVILSSFLLMVVIQAIAGIDSARKMPAPKQFVAISAAWGIMFLLAETGWGKLAARLSVLIVLTGMVVGPFGTLTINLLNKITDTFAIAPEEQATVMVPGIGEVIQP